MQVIPEEARSSAPSGTSIPSSLRNLVLPTSTIRPSTSHLTPPPVTLSKPEWGGMRAPVSLAYLTMAWASGCSESISAAATMPTTDPSETEFTAGCPTVHVPVLSRTTVSILAAASREDAVLNRMPYCEPRPVPTTMAIGVASPSAHGHAMTRIEIAIVRLNWTSRPASIHPMKTRTATTMTDGTNTAATLSAMFATGAFVPWAISIMRAIWNRTVSSPVFSILALRLPDPLTVAP